MIHVEQVNHGNGDDFEVILTVSKEDILKLIELDVDMVANAFQKLLDDFVERNEDRSGW